MLFWPKLSENKDMYEMYPSYFWIYKIIQSEKENKAHIMKTNTSWKNIHLFTLFDH